LLARGSEIPELFIVRRADKLRFFGGFHAFPGGKVHHSDAAISLVTDAGSQPTAEKIVAAARELFEETGVLLGRRADGSFPASGSLLEYIRRKLLAEELTFAQVLDRLELRVHADDFLPAGTAVTPAFAPTRFDTAFFVARLPENQQAEVWPGELTDGTWAGAQQALDRWLAADWLVTPPAIWILQNLREVPYDLAAQRVCEALAAASACAIPPIFFSPDVQLIPLHTNSLPPSTHTNAYLVGRERTYLIDPGTSLPEEQERLFQALDRQIAEGRMLEAIVLTHQHPDHVDAATVCAERYRLPVIAHPKTAERLQGKVHVDRELLDGDRLDLGKAPDGAGNWYLQAVHTPGHAAGHLAFYEPRYRLLFAADMVSTLSSVVIAPPEGDLVIYLQSLRLLQSFDSRLLLPAHGNPTACPQVALAECIAHRERREEQLVAALGSQPLTVAELTSELYKALLPEMIRFARLQVLAGLLKLEAEGRVSGDGSEPNRVWSLR
jgi:glyoxylase-like metal-dependent hydrolase (beta-lactamase superfamily II)/8-oxo-dGTP pyrophosphatase MutT (NUDIX family)